MSQSKLESLNIRPKPRRQFQLPPRAVQQSSLAPAASQSCTKRQNDGELPSAGSLPSWSPQSGPGQSHWAGAPSVLPAEGRDAGAAAGSWPEVGQPLRASFRSHPRVSVSYLWPTTSVHGSRIHCTCGLWGGPCPRTRCQCWAGQTLPL